MHSVYYLFLDIVLKIKLIFQYCFLPDIHYRDSMDMISTLSDPAVGFAPTLALVKSANHDKHLELLISGSSPMLYGS